MESNGLSSTPAINFCYLSQQGSDVHAFFFSCLNYVKKKSVFYQALVDFFGKYHSIKHQNI